MVSPRNASARTRVTLAIALLGAGGLHSARAFAQDGPPSEEPPPEEDEEIILDPELEDVDPPPPEATEPAPAPDATQVFLELRSRLGVETSWRNDREEVLEAPQLAALEIRHRLSDVTRVAAGIRLRYTFASRRGFEGGQDDFRHALELEPTAGYVDWAPIPALRARIGYQVLHLGRFEMFSASDVLAVRDFRGGPAAPASSTDVATPAARLDWDPASWLRLTAAYVPWFEPHRFDPIGTDYALLKLQGSRDGDALMAALESLVDRSFVPGYAAHTLRIFGPDPSFADPQAALRAVAHGTAGEVGMTLATAFDRVGAIGFSRAMERFMQGDIGLEELAADAADTAPVRVRYPRFWVAGVDGATDAGPVQLGAEVAYMADRVLYSARTGTFPRPELQDVVHVGLRGELARGLGQFVAIETFTQYAVDAPDDPDRAWFTLAGERFAWGVALVGEWALTPQWSIGGRALLFQGPSFVAVPRIQWSPDPAWFVELGALLVEGPSPAPLGSPDTAVGSIYDGVDQVFVGFGYRR